MAVLNALAGAQVPDGFTVKARLTTGTNARLAVSRSSGMGSATYFGPVAITAAGVATLTASGLTAHTTYYYAVEVDGVLDSTWVGTIRTAPTVGAATSFRFVASCCAGHANGPTDFYPPGVGATGVSNHSSFDLITAAAGEFFCHIGDMHYRDISTNSPALFRQALDDVLAAPRQAALYRSTGLVYMADDHDGGPDNRDASAASTPAYKQVYKERVPAQPMSDPSGLWQTWVYGRVRFILTDVRSERDPYANTDDASKHMLGVTQEQWFKDTLLAATEPCIIWLNTLTWKNPTVAGADSWAGYNTERTRIGDFITAHSLGGKIICISGDAHTNGVDDGRNNAWGGFPEVAVSAIDADTGGLSGSWSHGWVTGRGQYGVFDVVDHGEVITVTVTTYQNSTVQRIVTFVRRVTALSTYRVYAAYALDGNGALKSVFEKSSADLSSPTYRRWGASA